MDSGLGSGPCVGFCAYANSDPDCYSSAAYAKAYSSAAHADPDCYSSATHADTASTHPNANAHSNRNPNT